MHPSSTGSAVATLLSSVCAITSKHKLIKKHHMSSASDKAQIATGSVVGAGALYAAHQASVNWRLASFGEALGERLGDVNSSSSFALPSINIREKKKLSIATVKPQLLKKLDFSITRDAEDTYSVTCNGTVVASCYAPWKDPLNKRRVIDMMYTQSNSLSLQHLGMFTMDSEGRNSATFRSSLLPFTKDVTIRTLVTPNAQQVIHDQAVMIEATIEGIAIANISNISDGLEITYLHTDLKLREVIIIILLVFSFNRMRPPLIASI